VNEVRLMLLLEWMKVDLQQRLDLLGTASGSFSVDLRRKLEEVDYLLMDLCSSREQTR
jgi:hypothetical protein